MWASGLNNFNQLGHISNSTNPQISNEVYNFKPVD